MEEVCSLSRIWNGIPWNDLFLHYLVCRMFPNFIGSSPVILGETMRNGLILQSIQNNGVSDGSDGSDGRLGESSQYRPQSTLDAVSTIDDPINHLRFLGHTKSRTIAGLFPMTQPSCAGGMSTRSPGPNSSSLPSCILIPILPLRQ